MRVYISGKIGEEVLSEGTRRKFAEAEKLLQSRGFETFNPTTSGYGAFAEEFVNTYNASCPPHFAKRTWYDQILLMDLDALASCHAIYMLPDFLDSKGAKTEHALAIAMGKQVYYADELFDNGTLRREHNEGHILPKIENVIKL